MLWIQLFILIIVIWRDLYVIIWYINIYKYDICGGGASNIPI